MSIASGARRSLFLDCGWPRVNQPCLCVDSLTCMSQNANNHVHESDSDCNYDKRSIPDVNYLKYAI